MQKFFLFYWGDIIHGFLHVGAFFWPDDLSALMLLLLSIIYLFASTNRLVKAISTKHHYVFRYWIDPVYSLLAIVVFALLFHDEAASLRYAGFIMTYWFILIMVTTIARLSIWLYKLYEKRKTAAQANL